MVPTLPPQVMPDRSSRAGEWMLPAALITTGACVWKRVG